MVKLKEIAKYLVGAGIGAALTLGAVRNSDLGLEHKVSREDVNGDLTTDLLLYNYNTDTYEGIFLSQKNGNFKEVRPVAQSGHIFLVTDEGFYTFDGSYYPNDDWKKVDLKEKNFPRLHLESWNYRMMK